MSNKNAQSVGRPPIVVIMGHIDHGKSTLLDYIRKTNIVDTEAGGITQHISAYEVVHKMPNNGERKITFLDTPGHEAFKGMRARGARVADIAVLVVSAEDGVKAQTMEAFRSIMDAKIPFIVAINKIDKPNADIERTKLSLAESEIYIEGYGGEIPWVALSAKTGKGVDELLDIILLIAEMSELQGNPNIAAEGVVIESHTDPKKGNTASIVITNGTLSQGMFAVAEDSLSPVRVIENFLGSAVESATFSSPIRLIGWSSAPKVGARVNSYKTKKEAEATIACAQKTQQYIDNKINEYDGECVIIPLILKSDVAGTLEAVEHEISKLKHDRVKLKIIQKGIGVITESDIKIAISACDPLVLAFNTKADALAIDLASRNGIEITSFNIIYKLTEWLETIMKSRAPRIEVTEITGEIRVLKIFSQQKNKQVIGGRVTKGNISVNSKFKILRRDNEIGEGVITELQSQKIKKNEVTEGNECGMMIESPITVAERDALAIYTTTIKN